MRIAAFAPMVAALCASCAAWGPAVPPAMVSVEHEDEPGPFAEDPMIAQIRDLSWRSQAGTAETPGAGGAAARSGWALGPDLTSGGPSRRAASGAAKTAAAPAGSSLPDLPAGRSQEFLIAPGDELDVVVGGRPEFSGKVEVRVDGSIVLPTSGDLVRVSNMTAAEAALAVEAAVYPRYLRERARASVQVSSSPRLGYYVFGAVAKEGRFTLGASEVRLLDAVLAAGGIAEDRYGVVLKPGTGASWKRVNLITPREGAPAEVEVIDVEAIMRGDLARNVAIRPGQVVFVPGKDARADEAALNRLLGRKP